MPLYWFILLPFVGSLVAAMMPTKARNAAASWAALVAAGGLGGVLLLYPQVQGGQVLREQAAWLPQAGLAFVVRVDGFAWLFALMVTGIGFLVAVYARYYMSKDDPVPRFFSFFSPSWAR